MHKSKHIDLTCLYADVDRTDVAEYISWAKEYKPRGLCLNPVASDYLQWSSDALDKEFSEELPARGILRQFVLDFPLGQGGYAGKTHVADYYMMREWADEFDVVANISALLNNDYKRFSTELAPLTAYGKPFKVIVETGYYPTDVDILLRALEWCVRVGASAIKTSTGFIKNIDVSQKLTQISIWRSAIEKYNYDIKIKLAGGVRTAGEVDAALSAGADIVGTSSVITS